MVIRGKSRISVKIEQGVLNKFPGLKVAVVVLSSGQNKTYEKELQKMMEGVHKHVLISVDKKNIASHPQVSKWRTAYKKAGLKPSHYKSSIEVLSRMILKGKIVSKGNKLVDINNLVSLKHMVPSGIYDLKKIDGDIKLGIAAGTEVFNPFNSHDIEHPQKGEIVYKDARKVICRRWNQKDSNTTRITQDTDHAIMLLDCLGMKKEEIENICKDMKALYAKFAGGDIQYRILDIVQNDASFLISDRFIIKG